MFVNRAPGLLPYEYSVLFFARAVNGFLDFVLDVIT